MKLSQITSIILSTAALTSTLSAAQEPKFTVGVEVGKASDYVNNYATVDSVTTHTKQVTSNNVISISGEAMLPFRYINGTSIGVGYRYTDFSGGDKYTDTTFAYLSDGITPVTIKYYNSFLSSSQTMYLKLDYSHGQVFGHIELGKSSASRFSPSMLDFQRESGTVTGIGLGYRVKKNATVSLNHSVTKTPTTGYSANTAQNIDTSGNPITDSYSTSDNRKDTNTYTTSLRVMLDV